MGQTSQSRIFRQARGFTLIEVMIAMAIALIGMMGFASMMQMQGKMSKLIAQKMELITLKQTLLNTVNNPVMCRCNLDRVINTGNAGNLFINGTSKTQTEMNILGFRGSCDMTTNDNYMVQAGQPLQGTQTGMVVSDVKIKNVHSIVGYADEYAGTLTVDIDPSTQIQAMHPVEIPLVLGTDPTTPISSLRIQSCSGISSGSLAQTPIVCRVTGNVFTSSSGVITASPTVGTQSKKFSAGDCGGALPDSNYIGMFSKMFVCGTSAQWTVLQPGDGQPGFSMYTLADCVAPYAPADIEVVYIHK